MWSPFVSPFSCRFFGGLRHGELVDGSPSSDDNDSRKNIVVVGLGLVAFSFIEKVIKQDSARRYDIRVIGEEPHVAYNRIGLSLFFEHRKIEDLYLNPKQWYVSFKERAFDHHLHTRVTKINPNYKTVQTSTGDSVPYNILVFATGSDAVLPTHTPGHDAKGVFVKVKGTYYATQKMCPHKRAFVLSDGLVGDDDAGKYWVSCPYHKRKFKLNGEQAGRCSNDEELNIAMFPVKERDDGWVYLKLPPADELDSVLGTAKWKVKKGETLSPFDKMDQKYKGIRGKKISDGETASKDPVQSAGGIDW